MELVNQCPFLPWNVACKKKEIICMTLMKTSILYIASRTLSVSPKHALNSLIKESKFCNIGDPFLSNDINHDIMVLAWKVPTNPTQDASVGYRLGCIWSTKQTWLKNHRNWDPLPSNFVGEHCSLAESCRVGPITSRILEDTDLLGLREDNIKIIGKEQADEIILPGFLKYKSAKSRH